MNFSEGLKSLKADELQDILTANMSAQEEAAPDARHITEYLHIEYPEIFTFSKETLSRLLNLGDGEPIPEEFTPTLVMNMLTLGALCKALENRDFPKID